MSTAIERERRGRAEDERARHKLRQLAVVEKANRDVEEKRWRRRVLPLLPYGEVIPDGFCEGCVS